MTSSHKSRRGRKFAGTTAIAAQKNAPQKTGRRERRAEQTRLRIFRCALRLIAKRGLSNVTIEDITEAADVGKGTFFNYFDSKEHVLEVMAEAQLRTMREAAAAVGQGKRPIRVVLHRMILGMAKDFEKSPRKARAFLSSFQAEKEVRAKLLRTLLEGRQEIANLVAIGQQHGEIDRRLRKEQVAIQLLQGFLGTLMLWSIEERPALRTATAKNFESFWKSTAASEKRKRR